MNTRMRTKSKTKTNRWLAAIVLALPVASPMAATGPEAAGDRFGPPKRLLADRADWVTFDDYAGVFGSDGVVTIVEHRPSDAMIVRSRVRLDTPVTQGLLLKNDLYLVQHDESRWRLAVLDLAAPGGEPAAVGLDPAPAGRLRLARMDDYLLLAEEGLGIRILKPPHRMPDHPGHRADTGLSAVGSLPLETAVDAIAASLRTIYVATDHGLIVFDALNPALPARVGRIPLDFDVRAMTANGTRVYLLGSSGLTVLELRGGDEPVVVGRRPDAVGESIYFAGRSSYIAGGEQGLIGIEDVSVQGVNVNISVGDIFFSPAGLVQVNQGDTVTWTKPSTSFSHNVESCTPALLGCGGATATESFLSGGVTTAPFTFAHTFTTVGSNPYVCRNHQTTMQGDINVNGVSSPPPGVADGRNGTTPMTVGKLSGDAADLEIVYDAGACAADVDTHAILVGTGSTLPAAPGGTYNLSAGQAECAIGTTSPFNWIGSPPAPPAGDFQWFLLVAHDGAGTEGAWSPDAAGNERNGPGANGSSGECGSIDKDTTNTCPP